MMNSSSEMVKQISSEAMMPGRHQRQGDQAEGRPWRFAQIDGRLLQAAGPCWRKLPCRIAMAKGVQISVWPAMIDHVPLFRPSCISTSRSEIATITSGRTSGSMMKPTIPALPGKL